MQVTEESTNKIAIRKGGLNNDTNSTSHAPIMIFSTSLIQKLNSNEIRLPPSSIGVRRIRPSSKATRDAFKKKQTDSQEDQTSIVYKITDANGIERRMTNQEKKQYKLKLRHEKMEEKKKQKEKANDEDKGSELSLKAENSKENQTQTQSDTQNNDRQYFKLPLNQESIQNELAELRGDRGIPPVILSSAMASRALQMNALPPPLCESKYDGRDKEEYGKEGNINGMNQNDTFRNNNLICDTNDKLALHWSILIKSLMKNAEDIRSKESIRPMAYQIIPEVWTRLRPLPCPNSYTLTAATKNYDTNASSKNDWTYIPSYFPNKPGSSTSTNSISISKHEQDKLIVFEQIHRLSNVHISCGAKFGCDFLLYNGNREEQHAFAGLRVISSSYDKFPNTASHGNCVMLETSIPIQDINGEFNEVEKSSSETKSIIVDRSSRCLFPIPSPYDLAGYVRGLNTAGKLALLATVIRTSTHKDHDNVECDQDINHTQTHHVAFVDLALEKILSAPTHKKKQKWKKSGGKKRKEIGLNLKKVKVSRAEGK